MANRGNRTRNKLLLGLAARDFDLLHPSFERVLLRPRTYLVGANRRIEHAFFLEEGLASVLTGGSGKRPMEVGLFGSDGMSGLAVVQGSDSSPHECVVEIAGSALRIPVIDLQRAVRQSETLLRSLLIFGHVLMVQIGETARANGRFSVPQRLARWLLMVQDRLDRDDVPLTQEYLAIMVGARRVSVTLALHCLAEMKTVEIARGRVIIVDRAGLQEAAGDSYGVPEAEFLRLTAVP